MRGWWYVILVGRDLQGMENGSYHIWCLVFSLFRGRPSRYVKMGIYGLEGLTVALLSPRDPPCKICSRCFRSWHLCRLWDSEHGV